MFLFFALILKYGFNDTENLLLRQIQIVCFGRDDEVIPMKTFYPLLTKIKPKFLLRLS